jgi:hypothetical protein
MKNCAPRAAQWVLHYWAAEMDQAARVPIPGVRAWSDSMEPSAALALFFPKSVADIDSVIAEHCAVFVQRAVARGLKIAGFGN